jgi:hypothetical protein
MEMRDFQNALLLGAFDEHLDYLVSAVNERKRALAPKIWEFNVGDRIRYNKNTKPAYLVGIEGTITKINRTKVVVKLDNPVQRFSGNITTPLALIEKV